MMRVRRLAALSWLALCAPVAANASWPACPKGSGFFALFYGDPLGSEARRIVAAKPNFVVLGRGLEDRADVATFFHAGGVRAIAYITTGYSRRNAVESQVKKAM